MLMEVLFSDCHQKVLEQTVNRASLSIKTDLFIYMQGTDNLVSCEPLHINL